MAYILPSTKCIIWIVTRNIFSNKNQIQIKSLLLSHHHSSSALVSEIPESVLQTVQKNNNNNLHIDSTYTYRLYRRQCAKKQTYIYSVHTVYYKDILNYQYTLYTFYIMYTSIHSNMWRCNRSYIIQYICATIQISCATDSCAKVQQIIHMQCRGCALYGIQW